MTAQTIVHDLERRRHELLLKHAKLGDEAFRLAYDALVHNSFMARQKLREIDEEAARLNDEIELHNMALVEARRRVATAGRDWREVMNRIKSRKRHHERY
jgi:hypothetical protein